MGDPFSRFQYRYRKGAFSFGCRSAGILCQTNLRAFYLPGTDLVVQMPVDFDHLPDTGGTDRMPLGFESAGNIDGEFAAESGMTSFCKGSPFPRWAKHETFRAAHFTKGRCIVDFGNIDIFRTDTGPFIGLFRQLTQ